MIDEKTQHNHLDFLYVKHGLQNKGVGRFIWNEIEKLHPEMSDKFNGLEDGMFVFEKKDKS